jgi:tRNA pseudouridine55 synthase
MTLSTWLTEHSFGDGVIAIDKPYGMPSTAIVELYKRFTHEKVGHGGTLDPLAEGKMVLGIGKGTKKLTNYLAAEKKYRAEILFGAESESSDLELPLTYNLDNAVVSEVALSSVIDRFAHGYEQKISKFSAIKVKGRAQFKDARKGTDVVEKCTQTRLIKSIIHSFSVITVAEVSELLRQKREMLSKTLNEFDEVGELVGYHVGGYGKLFEKWDASLLNSIDAIQPLSGKMTRIVIEITVPKGTYIRSLVTALASELQTVGVLFGLQRLDAGNVDTPALI